VAIGPEERIEARALLAEALPLLAELIEEGVDHFAASAPERTDAAPEAEPVVEPASPTREEPPRGAVDARAAGDGERATQPAIERAPTLTLDAVREELGDCRRCDLCETRQKIVFGDGNPNADILFVGEGPGQDEDRRGLPFVGRAGQLLTRMIENGMGLERSDVYICNIVKCRPPRNRTPLPPEVAACRPFLEGQIEAVAPRVIVALGRPATGLLLEKDVSITRLRGHWQTYNGIPLMPTLHPAYVLRRYTPEVRRNVWNDLRAALARSRED